jgi:NADPH:quinone reductase-like Zn-dependent oxidoreductase
LPSDNLFTSQAVILAFDSNEMTNTRPHPLRRMRAALFTLVLERLGAHRVDLEGPGLSRRVRESFPGGVDAVLELVGNSTILNSLAMVRRGGRVCLAGFLGGLEPIPSFNPLLQLPSGVHFSFFGSFMFGTPEFPLNDVPLQTIIDRAAAGAYQAKPAAVFRFDEIREAHRLMEANRANGKLVVRV